MNAATTAVVFVVAYALVIMALIVFDPIGRLVKRYGRRNR